MQKTKIKSILFAFAAVSGFFILSSFNANAVSAATINVDSLAVDSVDNMCTLEDAVKSLQLLSAVEGCEAADGLGSDIINLTVPGTYLTNETFIISNPVTIQGVSADTYIIDGQNDHRLFTVNTAGSVVFDKVTLQGGNANSLTTGGAIFIGTGSLSVTNSRLVNNTASGAGGAIAANKTAPGIFNIVINNTEFRGNTTTADEGAAIYTFSTVGNINIALGNTTFDGHSTRNVMALHAAIGTFHNLTFSGNTTTTLFSLIYLDDSSDIIVKNNTFNGNQNGIFRVNSSTLQLANNLFNNNTPFFDDTCTISAGATITSLGGNIDSGDTCTSILNDVSDLNNQGDLNLGPLSYAERPMPLHGLLKGSKAIDAGKNSECLSVDARGVSRPFNGTCDMGAVELDKAPSISLYRFFNTRNGEHLFTTDTNEANFIRTDPGMNIQWNDEGIGYAVEETNISGTVAVYRLLQASTGYHHFTTDTNEVAVLSALPDWTNEGIKFYAYSADASGRSNVDRFFNVINGQHLFTIDEGESDFLKNSEYGQANWNFEKIEYFVYEN